MATESEILTALEGGVENAIHLRDLVERVRSPRGVVPFIGAGLSAPHFPSWPRFLTEAAHEWAPAVESEIGERIREERFEEAADCLMQHIGDRRFDELMRHTFGDHRLPRCAAGAISLLPELEAEFVMTTNFDRMIELAYRDSRQALDCVWGSRGAADAASRLQNGSQTLIKLHGDCSAADGRVLTVAEYTETYGSQGSVDPERSLPSLLEAALATRSLLFLGCSLKRDRTMLVMAAIARKFPDNVQFAVLSRSADPVQQNERARDLAAAGVKPIWYPPGKHECVEYVLRYLADARATRRARGVFRGAVASDGLWLVSVGALFAVVAWPAEAAYLVCLATWSFVLVNWRRQA